MALATPCYDARLAQLDAPAWFVPLGELSAKRIFLDALCSSMKLSGRQCLLTE